MADESVLVPSEKGNEDVTAHERKGLRIDDSKADPKDITEDGQIRIDYDHSAFS